MVHLFVYRLPDGLSLVHRKVEDTAESIMAYLTAIGKEYFGESVDLYISYVHQDEVYFVRDGTLLGRAVISKAA